LNYSKRIQVIRIDITSRCNKYRPQSNSKYNLARKPSCGDKAYCWSCKKWNFLRDRKIRSNFWQEKVLFVLYVLH